MSAPTHGQQRAGLITASIASVIMRGSDQAWETLIRNLWADDGSEFAMATGGARAHGHLQEPVGRSKFWERHPEFDFQTVELQPFSRPGFPKSHRYRRLLGCSPDGQLIDVRSGRVAGGIEVKSPVDKGTFDAYNAEIARRRLPHAHADQVRFSLWARAWPCWWYVVHHEDDYAELCVRPGTPEQIDWVARFRPRLDAFLDQYLAGIKPERDKLGAGALAALLGG